jgi:hypothetical protein
MSPSVRMGLVLLAFGALSLAGLIYWARRTSRTGGVGGVPPADPAHVAAGGDYELALRGGARVNGLHVSWPLATLRVGREQAELTIWGGVEPIRIARREVTEVRRVGAGPMGPGLKFRTESGRLDVTVWAGRDAAAELGRLGGD